MFMQEIEKLFISLKKGEMKIYKITTPHSTKCYVGKTTQTLNGRFSGHRSGFQQWLDGRTMYWCSSYGLLWLGDCSIELLEESEDSQAERKWISRLDCVNHYRMEYGIGDQYAKTAYNRDRYVANSEEKRANSSKRYAEKREEIKAYTKRYAAANREKILAGKRAYYLQNKEELAVKQRAYAQEHAAERNARNAERVACDRCGDVMARSSLLTHQRRQKCKDTAAGKVLKAKRCICERCGTEYSHRHKHRHQRTTKCQTLYAAKIYTSINE